MQISNRVLKILILPLKFPQHFTFFDKNFRTSDHKVAGLTPGNNPGQVVHTHAPLFTRKYNVVPVKGPRCSAAGKVTVGPKSGVTLAKHHGLSGLSTYRLNGYRKGD